ncbi:MAG: hypothetical protein EOO61_03880 [Hymenobacter sp.]|nr:MAG: hypothetical protein EOO61_03880 [Hymenobacter sp.]
MEPTENITLSLSSLKEFPANSGMQNELLQPLLNALDKGGKVSVRHAGETHQFSTKQELSDFLKKQGVENELLDADE